MIIDNQWGVTRVNRNRPSTFLHWILIIRSRGELRHGWQECFMWSITDTGGLQVSLTVSLPLINIRVVKYNGKVPNQQLSFLPPCKAAMPTYIVQSVTFNICGGSQLNLCMHYLGWQSDIAILISKLSILCVVALQSWCLGLVNFNLICVQWSNSDLWSIHVGLLWVPWKAIYQRGGKRMQRQLKHMQRSFALVSFVVYM